MVVMSMSLFMRLVKEAHPMVKLTYDIGEPETKTLTFYTPVVEAVK